MTQPQQPQFDAASVPIHYTLNFHQVDVILKGLAKLPREETDPFYEQVKGHAVQSLQAAEAAYNEAAEKAAAEESARNTPPDIKSAE